jgi:hypothetical protein
MASMDVRARGGGRVTAHRASNGHEDPFLAWSQQIATARGRRLDFAAFPYQREIYAVFGDEGVHDAVVMKGVQLGISELLVRVALYFPDQLELNSLYVYPAGEQMGDFSEARVKRLIDNDDYLRERVSSPLNKRLMAVGHAFCYLRGSTSSNDLIGVDADVVVLDEYDSLVPKNIPQAEARVAGSFEHGLIRRVGVPSDPEYGIAKRFEQSDKRQWMVRCGCKAGWQPLDFWKNAYWEEDDAGMVERPYIGCWRCERRLDVLKGKWVAEHPDRSLPGFHVHRLMVPGERNLRNVIHDSKETDSSLVESFWNNHLGLPYSTSTSGLDREAIAAARSAGTSWNDGEPLRMLPAYRGPNVVTMGVDVASTRALNVRISEHLDSLENRRHRKRMLWVGKVESFNELAALMDRYNVTIACIDHLPEYRLSTSFAQMFPGRVYIVYYDTNLKREELVSVNSENLTVSVMHVPVLDATVEVMLAQRNLLTEEIPTEYIEHMIRPRRVIERNAYNQPVPRWHEKGPTDYFQAEVYDLVATEVLIHRINAAAITETRYALLDDYLDFERSTLDDPDDMTYRKGPPDPDDELPPWLRPNGLW